MSPVDEEASVAGREGGREEGRQVLDKVLRPEYKLLRPIC